MTIELWTNSQIKILTNWFGIIRDDHGEGEELARIRIQIGEKEQRLDGQRQKLFVIVYK